MLQLLGKSKESFAVNRYHLVRSLLSFRYSVPHERLLFKLQRYTIDGSLLLWIRNFLTNRKQRVVLMGTRSDWSPVISGVPQGTILGPILLIIYTNDISSDITSQYSQDLR